MLMDYNPENPMVRDGLWNNDEYYGDPDEPEYPEGYYEKSIRIYIDNLSEQQALDFTRRTRKIARECRFDVEVKRFDRIITVEGVLNYDEQDSFWALMEEYENYGVDYEEIS